jgi:Ca-activated chloride channel family protein
MKKATNPRRALLLITDGEDNRSRYSFSNVRDFIKEQDVQLYAIGIVDEHASQLTNGRTGRRLMEELTEVTGGRAYFPESLDELEDICARIALELKSQYVLGYRSTNDAKDGRWRKLRVRIESPKGSPDLDVRARSGYAADAGGSAATKTSHQ